MRARLEYLTQRPVKSIRRVKNDTVVAVTFEDGVKLYVLANPPNLPEIEGLSLLTVEGRTLTFGRSSKDSGVIESSIVTVTIPPGVKRYRIDMPGYDDTDRDLTIPPHPNERIADGPVE